MAWILLFVQLILALVLLVASAGKFLAPEKFAAVLQRSYLPTTAASLLAVATPASELVVAAALLLSPARWLVPAMLAAILLFAGFTAWMTWVVVRQPGGTPLRCACFGFQGEPIGARSLARNVAFMLIAGGGVYLAQNTSSPLPAASVGVVITASSIGMIVFLVMALLVIREDLALIMSDEERSRLS